MTNFMEALDTKTEEVERPPLVPQGTYNAMISAPAQFGKIESPNFNAETITFKLRLLSANENADDVDEDDLAAYGDLSKAFVEHKFLFNTEDEAAFANTKFALSKFLENTLNIHGKTIKEGCAEAQNEPLIVTVGWRPDKNDPEVFYTKVKATAPAE